MAASITGPGFDGLEDFLELALAHTIDDKVEAALASTAVRRRFRALSVGGNLGVEFLADVACNFQ